MQLRTHISDFRKKTHSKLPFLWQILQFLSIFLNPGVPFDNLLRPPRAVFPKLFKLSDHKTWKKNWRTTKSLNNYSLDHKLDDC